MTAPVKNLDAPHKIISLNVLATGQLILTTENRVYEYKDGKWQPMLFADDPTPPTPEPATETKIWPETTQAEGTKA